MDNNPRTVSMLSIDIQEGVAWLTIDLPDRSVNILTRKFMEALASALQELASRDGLTGLVIRSGKKRSFIAGADISEIKKTLGWRPKIDIKRGIHKTINSKAK